jgi:hypothetical protein
LGEGREREKGMRELRGREEGKGGAERKTDREERKEEGRYVGGRKGATHDRLKCVN